MSRKGQISDLANCGQIGRANTDGNDSKPLRPTRVGVVPLSAAFVNDVDVFVLLMCQLRVGSVYRLVDSCWWSESQGTGCPSCGSDRLLSGGICVPAAH